MTTYITNLDENVFEVFDNWVAHYNPRLSCKNKTMSSRGTYKENDDHFEYKFNVAGALKENIKLSIENKKAILKIDQEELNYYNSFSLPEKADINKIEAKYQDGILSLKVFNHEQLKPVNIDIK